MDSLKIHEIVISGLASLVQGFEKKHLVPLEDNQGESNKFTLSWLRSGDVSCVVSNGCLSCTNTSDFLKLEISLGGDAYAVFKLVETLARQTPDLEFFARIKEDDNSITYMRMHLARKIEDVGNPEQEARDLELSYLD